MRVSFETTEPVEDVVALLERVYGVRISIARTRGRSRHDKAVTREAEASAEPSGGTETT